MTNYMEDSDYTPQTLIIENSITYIWLNILEVKVI